MLKKITVKIVCTEDCEYKEGSGFIAKIGGEMYVLTCAHCLTKESDKKLFSTNHIAVYLMYNYERTNIQINDPKIDKDTDTGIIKINSSGDATLDIVNKVKFINDNLVDARLSGFAGGKEDCNSYNFTCNSETKCTYKDVDITTQYTDAIRYWNGMSGGGFFGMEANTNTLYVVACLKGLEKENGDYSSFVMVPISCFKKLLPEITFEDIENYTEPTKETQCFFSIDKLLKQNQEYKHFIRSKKTTEIIKALRNEDVKTILFTGLSGLGKSRILYEAFNTGINIPNAFYCQFEEDSKLLVTQLDTILSNHQNEEGLIIIDDCPLLLLSELIDHRNKYNRLFRLIVTNHNYFDVEDDCRWMILRITPSDMSDEVNDFIDEILVPTDKNRSSVEDIKRISEGYPGMALPLIKVYREGGTASVEDVDFLMPKLLKFDDDKNLQNKQFILMQTLSLCQPMPYNKQQRDAFKYIISSDKFTPLYKGVEYAERRDITERLILKYKPTLIDLQSEWLNVRPFPLAVWLTKKWFKNCNSERFKELIDEIRKQEPNIQKIVSEGFCKHIEQMHGNKEAFELVQSLVDPKEGDSPFLNEEVLCSGLGSRFFLAMSAVNPAAIAFCLSSLILPKSKEWLMDNLSEEARRNIVWGLEKMCFARESYKDAFKVLAKLAVSENEEHISNNATGQLRQLFHIHLSGTEASLEERIELLDYLINAGPEYNTIAVNCIASALDNGGFVRMGGSEKFGMERKTDYMPKTYAEIFAYWRNCRDMLIKCVEADPLNIETVSHIVETHTYRWIVECRTDILIPLLECISARKNNRWDAEYEQLCKSRRMNKTAPSISEEDDIQQWINKLRPRLFLSDLKDLRYELWDNYHTNADYSFEESKRLFEPLADKFVSTKVYSIKEEMSALLDDRDYIDAVFPILIKEKMNEDASTVMFDTIFEIVKEKGDNYNSSLLHSICIRFIGEKSLEDFLLKIKDASMLTLYVQLMTSTEDEGLSHLKRLSEMEKSGEIKDFLPVYLGNFQSLKTYIYELMINTVYELYPSEGSTILNAIIRKQFFYNPTTESNLLPLIKKLLINYDLESENAINLIDYTRYLEDLLHNLKDDYFAREINKKFIAYHQSRLRSNDCKEIFKVLIKEYTSAVWDDFMGAFLAEDGYLFAWQVKDVIGSGFGFGAGPLFQIEDWKLKLQDLCVKYPDTAPCRIAETAPCYCYGRNENGQHVIGFSDIIMWLLDNFGKDQKVRDGIHSNIGSFSWTGSVIPYHEDNIACFKQLENHKISEVKEWAVLCVKEFELQMEAEKSKEDYLRIHYGV